VRRIGVLTQYKAQSLIRHVERGWGFLSSTLGEYIDVVPAQQQQGEAWYTGTADALWQNLDLVREAAPDHVIVLGGDHVYKMDYGAMLGEHVERGARASVACIEVPIEEAHEFGVLAIDEAGFVVAFDEKPAQPRPAPGRPGRALASMGIYVFDTALLLDELARDAADPDSSHDFGHDLLPRLVSLGQLHAHRFEDSCVNVVDGRPYWRDVGTVDAYWAANMDLTQVVPELNLYDDAWPVLSQQRQLPPAKFVLEDSGRLGVAMNSLVSSGCIVSGATVRRSILFSKVRVAEGSLIEDSLLLPNVAVGRDVRQRLSNNDKHCVLPDGFRAGIDAAADRARGFHVTASGITLVSPEMIGQVGRVG
jgi:glucose-1-phosphate adenylyltransferase